MKNTMLDEFIDRLRNDANIVNVIADYVALTKKGKNYWGCCPFHQENTPSFTVSADKGLFYCFGCQNGGDVFSFLMKKENVAFFDAVKLLAGKMNIPLPEIEKTPREKMLEEENRNLFRAGELARDFYHACLMQTNYGEAAREYLAQRGVCLESINLFKLGFAPPTWDKLTIALTKKGITLDILLKAGLSASRRSNDSAYDRFRNRLMFPICDERGRVIGFGGRTLDNDEPKYLNSPETRLFNKRHVLYAFDIAKMHIKNSGKAIIVEGYLDAITAHSFGFKNVVASLGTAFTKQQAGQILKCNDPEFIFSYDSDNAGIKASERALTNLKNMLGTKIKVITIPGAKDPDEFLRQNGPDAFKNLLDNPKSLLEYQIERGLANIDYSNVEGKMNAVAQLAPLLASSDNPVEINAHITHLSQTIGVYENDLRTEIKKNKKDKNVKAGKDNVVSLISRQPLSAAAKAQNSLIRLMLENNEIIPYCAANLKLEELSGETIREIINFIFNAYNMKGNISPTVLHTSSHALSDNAKGELSHIMLADITQFQQIPSEAHIHDNNILGVVDDYIKAIKLDGLKRVYEHHRLAAAEMERAGNSDFLQELTEMQRIKNEIKKIYQS